MSKPQGDVTQSIASQYTALAALSALTICLTAVLLGVGRQYFRPYFGTVHPLLVVLVTVVVGFL